MNLNINLFVHGVPMGQKIWGPKGDDQRYISSFYGPKWDAPEVMKIDVMTFGGTQFCYYSYIKGQNVYDSQGRAGAYFALTLRVNAFYADVQNLYNILKASYDKICVGLFIQETNGSTRFTLPDFLSIDKELKDLENRILSYIGEYSVGSDLLDISGINVNGQASACVFNLHECTSIAATKAIKQCGKIMVSPWYLSENAAKTVEKYKDEMMETSKKAQQELLLLQQNSRQQINEILEKSEKEIATVKSKNQEELIRLRERNEEELNRIKEDCDRRVNEVKQSYADVDDKLRSLNNSNREKDREIAELKAQSRKKDKELQNYISRIRESGHQVGLSDTNLTQPGFKEPSWLYKNKKWVYAGCVFFLLLLLVGLILWAVIVDPKDKQLVSPKNVVYNEKNTTQNNDSIISGYNIQIKELKTPNDSISLGQSYSIEIVGEGADTLSGTWKSDEFKFIGDSKIMAKRQYAGKKGKILYIVDDKECASLMVNIKSGK